MTLKHSSQMMPAVFPTIRPYRGPPHCGSLNSACGSSVGMISSSCSSAPLQRMPLLAKSLGLFFVRQTCGKANG